MSGETRAFFFHQIMGQEDSRRKLFSNDYFSIMVECVTGVGKL